ncbi:unnamed protein product [Moneuplotes crassus]|uniref:Uncharacterized protein n=2 Tax=Euplotes crassus TaxID=5936 RepID=A0AAD1U674_EUPCR|nr:unnamed protein product [Moneuplotes crassus]
MECRKIKFESSFNIWTIVAPYYGYMDDWYLLTTRLCKKSRELMLSQDRQFFIGTNGHKKSINLIDVYSRIKKFQNPWVEFPLFLFKIKLLDYSKKYYFSKIDDCIIEQLKLSIDFFKNLQNVLVVVKEGIDKCMDPEKIQRFKRFMIQNGNIAWDYQHLTEHKDKFFSIVKNCNVNKEIYEYLLVSINLSEPIFDSMEEGEIEAYLWSITGGIYFRGKSPESLENEKEHIAKTVPFVNITLSNTNFEYQEDLSDFLKTDTSFVNIRKLHMIITDQSFNDLKIAQESVYCKDTLEMFTVFSNVSVISSPKKMALRISFPAIIIQNALMSTLDLCLFQLVKDAKMLSFSAEDQIGISMDLTIIEITNAKFFICDRRLDHLLIFEADVLKITSDDNITEEDYKQNLDELPLSFCKAVYCENIKVRCMACISPHAKC